MKKFETKGPSGDVSVFELPDYGFLIEGGKIVKYDGAEAYRRSLDPSIDNHASQIFWTKEGAQERLREITDPVEYHLQRLKGGEITGAEFRWLVGDLVASKRLERDNG